MERNKKLWKIYGEQVPETFTLNNLNASSQLNNN